MKKTNTEWYKIEWDFYLLDKPKNISWYNILWIWNDTFWNQTIKIEKNWIIENMQNDYSFDLNITNLIKDIYFNEFIKSKNWLKMLKWLDKKKKDSNKIISIKVNYMLDEENKKIENEILEIDKIDYNEWEKFWEEAIGDKLVEIITNKTWFCVSELWYELVK